MRTRSLTVLALLSLLVLTTVSVYAQCYSGYDCGNVEPVECRECSTGGIFTPCGVKTVPFVEDPIAIFYEAGGYEYLSMTPSGTPRDCFALGLCHVGSTPNCDDGEDIGYYCDGTVSFWQFVSGYEGFYVEPCEE